MQPDYSNINDENRTKRVKQLIIIVIIALMLPFIAYQIFNYLTHGNLVINTNDKSSQISILNVVPGYLVSNSNASKVMIQYAQISKSVSLKGGNYLVIVKGQTGSAIEKVSVVNRKKSVYTIKTATNPTPLELVANANATSLGVGGSDLYYIDQKTKNLLHIDSHNQITQVSNKFFKYIDWVNGDFGIGQEASSLIGLDIINHGVVTQLPTSQIPNPNNEIVLSSISPSGTIYITVGVKLYFGNASGNFKLLYNAPRQPANIFASNNNLLIKFNNSTQTFNSPSTSSASNLSYELIAVNQDGSSKTVQDVIGKATWSPSGDNIFTYSDSSGQVLDSKLGLVSNVPISSIRNASWLNDDVVLFMANDQLWQYNIKTNTGDTITRSINGRAVESAVVSPDKSYIYVTVDQNPGSYTDTVIERYSLSGVTVSSNIYKVQSNMPYLVGRCLIYMVNYAKPPSILSYGGQPSDNCPQTASNFVQGLGVDPGYFNYGITDTPPNVPNQ